MKFNFDEKFSEFLKIIINSAKKQGKRIFFAGGALRDNLLNISSKDIDLLFEGDAVEFCKNLPEKIKIKSIHKDFATLKLLYNDIETDIASTRLESYPYSGCLPVVEKIGVDISLDYKRRDFSINALYCELLLNNDEIEYKLFDFSCGVDDIKNKTLKVLHDKSYIDDPTRILRGVAFKHRFGFDFSNHDKMLIKSYLDKIDRKNMSLDRVESVFKLILQNKENKEIFFEIIDKKYYKILSSDEINFNLEQFKKTYNMFLNLMDCAKFYFLILKNPQIEKTDCKNLLQSYRTFSKFNIENLAYYFYKTDDIRVEKYLKIKDIKLFLKGADLINSGFCEGKKIGLILDSLLFEKLKNASLFPDKTSEINWVLENFPIKK